MGQTLIIINETQLAYELMEKRSLKHSSRPSQIFAGEMYGHAVATSNFRLITQFNFHRVGWENSLAFIPYSNRFRAHRKYMAQILGSKVAASRFNLLQEVEVGRFLLRTLETPDDLLEHFRTSVLVASELY
jgi:hypothetical protein